eukprot:SAG22_NODE_3428_length_1718_cov_3.104385_2_plen_130_part_00
MAESALSITNGANQLMSMTTAVLGGVLGDRYGKRAVLAGGFALFVWTMVVSAFTTSFTVVLFVNLYQGLVGGVLGAPINALMSDVLPIGTDGKPSSPTRCAHALPPNVRPTDTPQASKPSTTRHTAPHN